MSADSRRTSAIGEGMSIWLDLVRVCAAFAVVLFHLAAVQMGGAWLRVGRIGDAAVIVFFVLSGFVIAYVADTREGTIQVYAASRLARLWSILIPALAVTLIVDRIGLYLDPTVYEGWGRWLAPLSSPLQLVATAAFVNELWFAVIPPLSNAPAWSIGFEFWYYAIFGAAYYLKRHVRILTVFILCLVAGPKILLLMPVWLFGVAAYWISRSFQARPVLGLMLMAAAAAAAILIVAAKLAIKQQLHVLESDLLGEHVFYSIGHAQGFILHTVLGVIVGISFVGFSGFQDAALPMLRPFRRVISWISYYTLSIYLFHFPLMLMISAALNKQQIGPIRSVTTLCLTVAGTIALGYLFEPQRLRIRIFLAKLFDRFGKPLAIDNGPIPDAGASRTSITPVQR
jgi:peptidoglycan/LPS O-acetylase OafA/YrhL